MTRNRQTLGPMGSAEVYTLILTIIVLKPRGTGVEISYIKLQSMNSANEASVYIKKKMITDQTCAIFSKFWSPGTLE